MNDKGVADWAFEMPNGVKIFLFLRVEYIETLHIDNINTLLVMVSFAIINFV